MYIPNLKWPAEAILEVVDDTELVMVQKERYLGVWHGDLYARVYDLKGFCFRQARYLLPTKQSRNM
jgi:hypothetical protein